MTYPVRLARTVNRSFSSSVFSRSDWIDSEKRAATGWNGRRLNIKRCAILPCDCDRPVFFVHNGRHASRVESNGLVGKPAPDFALKSVAGPNLRLSEYRSDVVVLNFWSNWCGKCINAVNALEELNRQHRSSGLRVFTIDVDGRNGAQLAKEVDPGYPVLLDIKSRVSKAYDLSRLPITVVIDREGTVRFVQKGFKGTAEQQLQAEVLALLDE